MDKGLILYPCYFDRSLKRSEGRRTSRAMSVQEPSPSTIERILKSNKITFTHEEKSHPAYWWKREGRFMVDYTGTKRELISIIGKALSDTGKKA